jgi:hypothetical protein
VRLTPAQWIELSTDGQTDFGAIGTVSTNPGVQGRQEDTLQSHNGQEAHGQVYRPLGYVKATGGAGHTPYSRSLNDDEPQNLGQHSHNG